MRITRILALSAAALVSVGLLTAPPASAATSVTIDCAAQTTENFTVTPGEEIVFTLNTVCRTILGNAGVNADNFTAFVNSIVQNNTGATISPVWGDTPTVTYTAGSAPGTDSLVLSTNVVIPNMRERGYRNGALVNAYYMTVPGAAGPAPWFQGIGRSSKDATCPATYGPSWAEWMNNGTGGWVCVREYYYDNSLGDWSYRRS